jgi:hypothetical protein
MSFLTKTLKDGHRMFICIPRIFFNFFKIYLKYIFIISAFAPMSQNTMSRGVGVYNKILTEEGARRLCDSGILYIQLGNKMMDRYISYI